MLGLDQNGSYLISALATSAVVLAGYGLYLRSRLRALRRRVDDADQSTRKAMAAAPMPSTAQATSSANGPSTS